MQTTHKLLLGDLLYLWLEFVAGAEEDGRGEEKRHGPKEIEAESGRCG
jgi:hypothetical protein